MTPYAKSSMPSFGFWIPVRLALTAPDGVQDPPVFLIEEFVNKGPGCINRYSGIGFYCKKIFVTADEPLSVACECTFNKFEIIRVSTNVFID